MAQCDKLRFPVPAAGPEAPHTSELLIRRSRFIAQSCRCAGADAAREFIAQIRKKHPDATHNCWAFQAGPPGDTACIGFSDDGEPHGTAGRPMLTALLHCGIGQICVVVSRWFGGIKLGTGGLVRAYQESVQTNVAQLPVGYAIPLAHLEINMPYACQDAIRRLLPAYEAATEKENYSETVNILVRAPLDRVQELETALANASNGAVTLKKMGTENCLDNF